MNRLIRRQSLRVATIAFSLLIAGSAASADPIRVITSGDVFTGNDDTGFGLNGPGFSFMASRLLEPIANCGPCAPGSVFSPSAALAIQGWTATSATIDGHSYGQVFLSGMFNFAAGSVIVPNMPPGQSGPDAEGLSREFTNFTFTGTLAGFADASLSGTPLFSTDLAGRGLSVIAFSNYPPESGIRVLQLDYHFDAAAPTPEPASLLLLGTGAAWIATRARRRISTP